MLVYVYVKRLQEIQRVFSCEAPTRKHAWLQHLLRLTETRMVATSPTVQFLYNMRGARVLVTSHMFVITVMTSKSQGVAIERMRDTTAHPMVTYFESKGKRLWNPYGYCVSEALEYNCDALDNDIHFLIGSEYERSNQSIPFDWYN